MPTRYKKHEVIAHGSDRWTAAVAPHCCGSRRRSRRALGGRAPRARARAGTPLCQFPAALQAVADWLHAGHRNPGVRERPGVYGSPLCPILDARALRSTWSTPVRRNACPAQNRHRRLPVAAKTHPGRLRPSAFRPTAASCV